MVSSKLLGNGMPNRDTSLSDEDLEELLESIPYHDQIIHSIQGTMTSGCTCVIAR